jgi:hypothetical protein
MDAALGGQLLAGCLQDDRGAVPIVVLTTVRVQVTC